MFAGNADSVSYAYCSGSSEPRAFVSRRWQLVLVDSPGRLAEVRATTALVGP